jgi:hypothetical protein
VGMEGMVVKFKDQDGQKMHWLGFLSDEKQQDARTSFYNSTKMILRMDMGGYLQADEDQVLHVVSDGCTSQYKCATTLQTYIWLADMFQIPIDVMVTAPYHGKSLVDALAGVDKSLLSNKLIKGFDSATRGANGKIISQAEVCYKVLADPARRFGDVTDSKHKRKEGEESVEERYYHVSNYTNENPIPIKDCTFKINPQQWGKGTKNKIKEMFHFYYHPDMPVNTCAVRMIPCHCSVEGGCKDQIMKPWDLGKSAQDQERFKLAPNCVLTPLLDDLNEWRFITPELVEGSKNSNKGKRQINKLFQLSLDAHVSKIEDDIKLQGFGAISSGDDRDPFWLVQWTSKPFELQEPTRVEGASRPMPQGTKVAKGFFYNRIHQAPGWFEKDRTQREPSLFWLQHVLDPAVMAERYHPKDNTPPPAANKEYDRRNAQAFVRYVPKNMRNIIIRTRTRMSKFDPYQLDDDDNEGEDANEEEEDADSDDEEEVDNDLEDEQKEQVEENNNDDSEEESEPEEE